MRSINGSLVGLVLADILAIVPTAAFAHGGGGGGFGGGGHGFGGGHAFAGFTGRGFSPGFGGTRGFSTGRFSGRGDLSSSQATPGPWIQGPILRTSIAATVRPTQQGNKE